MLPAIQMHDSPQLHSPDASNPVETLARLFKWSASALALAGYSLVLFTEVTGRELPGKPDWPEALLVFLAALATVTSLSRQLPMQNVILGAVIIAVLGSLAHGLGVATASPFGPFTYADAAGPRLLNLVAWPVPLIWIVAVLNSRGVARLILRPWRKLRTYGFWLIGVTVGLTVLFDAALEPFAAAVKHYWLWQPTRVPLTWAGTPITNFLGWLLTALLILAFVTPVLIDKRARPMHRAPVYHPLVVWLLALLLFAIGCGLHQLWLPTGFCTVVGITVGLLAWRGARW